MPMHSGSFFCLGDFYNSCFIPKSTRCDATIQCHFKLLPLLASLLNSFGLAPEFQLGDFSILYL